MVKLKQNLHKTSSKYQQKPPFKATGKKQGIHSSSIFQITRNSNMFKAQNGAIWESIALFLIGRKAMIQNEY
jgi:hypothetical protein